MQTALALSCTHFTSSSAASLCLAKVSPPHPFSCSQRQYFFQKQFKLQWNIPLCKMVGLVYLHSECSAEVSLPHSSRRMSTSVQAEGRERGHLPSLVLLLSGILECKEPDLQLSRAWPRWHTCKQSGLKMASTAIFLQFIPTVWDPSWTIGSCWIFFFSFPLSFLFIFLNHKPQYTP